MSEACENCPLGIRKICESISALTHDAMIRPVLDLDHQISNVLESLENKAVTFNEEGVWACIKENGGNCMMSNGSLKVVSLLSELSWSLNWQRLADEA